MITLESVLLRVSGLDEARLREWIEEGWVRPVRQAGRPVFQEIDIARCRLILELQEELEVNESAVPVVLNLLDQLHQTRAQLRRVVEVLERSRAGSSAT
jgi:chaperone modulatory protein CbpM